VSVADEFRLCQHHQSNPHLCQACSRLRQSSPPPINNIPCRHPKSPATLWLKGRQIIVHGQHHACATPMAKRPKKAKNEFSGSCAVTNCTSGPAQPHHPTSEWGGSAPVGCSVIIVVNRGCTQEFPATQSKKLKKTRKSSTYATIKKAERRTNHSHAPPPKSPISDLNASSGN
jgi:hypothetical protein